jgi:hypothetical protein
MRAAALLAGIARQLDAHCVETQVH